MLPPCMDAVRPPGAPTAACLLVPRSHLAHVLVAEKHAAEAAQLAALVAGGEAALGRREADLRSGHRINKS